MIQVLKKCKSLSLIAWHIIRAKQEQLFVLAVITKAFPNTPGSLQEWLLHSLIHSFNQYLPNTRCLQGTGLVTGNGDARVKRGLSLSPSPLRIFIWPLKPGSHPIQHTTLSPLQVTTIWFRMLITTQNYLFHVFVDSLIFSSLTPAQPPQDTHSMEAGTVSSHLPLYSLHGTGLGWLRAHIIQPHFHSKIPEKKIIRTIHLLFFVGYVDVWN